MAVTERHIAIVPPATHLAQTRLQPGQKWLAEYNVACWLRARLVTAQTTITLVLRYRDAAGEQQVAVDQAACGKDGSVLLSAVATVPATGPVAEMSVSVLLSSPCEIAVDELFVQRRGDTGAQAGRIITAG